MIIKLLQLAVFWLLLLLLDDTVVVVHGQSTLGTCIEDIQQIYVSESLIFDTSFPRTYVLCPRRIFEIGRLDYNLELIGVNVHPPLPISSNIHIKCGDDGLRDNLCWFFEGDIHIDATEFRGITNPRVDNVIIEGIVFIGALRHSLWATKPGSITFIDCEFRDFTKSIAPMLLDWYDGTDSQLTVTIQDSSFHDNRYSGMGSNTALIYANSVQNSLDIQGTIFENNDMLFNNTMNQTSSFLIETLGPLRIKSSCFINNRIGVSNAVVFGNNPFREFNVYVSNSSGALCGFASVFENIQQFDSFTPVCYGAMGDECRTEDVPTSEPSPFPTTLPSIEPSSYPTVTPTESPTSLPSDTPTTFAPTLSPTSTPSTELTTTPTGNISHDPTVSASPSSQSAAPSSQSVAPTYGATTIIPTISPTTTNATTALSDDTPSTSGDGDEVDDEQSLAGQCVGYEVSFWVLSIGTLYCLVF